MLTLYRVRIILLFHEYSKVMYYIGNTSISFVQEWIEQRQQLFNICTALALEMTSKRKQKIMTYANAQNGQI